MLTAGMAGCSELVALFSGPFVLPLVAGDTLNAGGGLTAFSPDGSVSA
jgi:hypothetical protein